MGEDDAGSRLDRFLTRQYPVLPRTRLYRLVRKHGGKQEDGWQFDFRHLYRKSGSTARYSDFALDLRALVTRQSLPGYHLSIVRIPPATELLAFRPVP